MRWYALSTGPRRERLAEDCLKVLGVETLAPRFRRRRAPARPVIFESVPLFPGYLFARFDMAAMYRIVKYTRGVRGVVSFGSVPAVVDETVVEEIRARLEEGLVVLARHAFVPGQVLRIRSGPLQGLEAVFEREMSDQERVVVLLRALAYQPRATVPVDDLIAL